MHQVDGLGAVGVVDERDVRVGHGIHSVWGVSVHEPRCGCLWSKQHNNNISLLHDCTDVLIAVRARDEVLFLIRKGSPRADEIIACYYKIENERNE